MQNGFIKTGELPVKELNSEQKAKLNRRGNELFNLHDIKSAEKIFMTTGYSDGLARVGDYYAQNNQKITALKFYRLAHNTYKENVILDELVNLLRLFID